MGIDSRAHEVEEGMTGRRERQEQGSAQPRAVLVCTAGALKGQRTPVGEAGLMLGRGESCDIVVLDAGVSREHARVLWHNDAVWVQDAGSRNGCFLNGRRVARHQSISPGDELRIGEHVFTLELEDPFPEGGSVSNFGQLAPPPPPPPPPRARRRPPLPLIALAVLIGLGLVVWMFAGR